jgi:hypothetical protein
LYLRHGDPGIIAERISMCCGITGTVRSDEANIVGVAGKRRELMAGLLSMLSNQLIICPSILGIGILHSTLSS